MKKTFCTNKYKNFKTFYKGKTFDSKLEASHFLLLEQRLMRGEIKDLSRQVKIQLSDKPKGRQRSYVADFVYFDVFKNVWVIQDSKGMKVEPYQTKRDWILDKFFGFIFVEKSKGKEVIFEPYGDKKINFLVKS